MFKIVMKKNDLNRHKVGLIRLDTKFFFLPSMVDNFAIKLYILLV